jgi:NADPH:quinone reductase-like Zn-dependent oxidoreductase
VKPSPSPRSKHHPRCARTCRRQHLRTEVLVRVHASSVNPADNSIAAGTLKHMGVEYEFPVILGRDYAGVVEQVGAQVEQE